ncbi:MAG: GIY-YIG nuclease family protein [Bacteroidales bacterium]|nr:GIY-YIG nuclease family protein [Bacteroidales bacterium]
MTKEDKATLTKYIEDKDYASVIDYCSSKIELDKSDYLFLGTRGWAYIEIEEYDKAIIDFTKSIELNSEYVQGWFNRGRCYYYKSDDKLALADFKKSLFIEPKLSSSNYYIGHIYACLENYEKSIEHFSAYLLDNKDEEVLKLRVELYHLTNQNEKASRDIAELLSTEIDKIEEIESLNSARVAEFSNIKSLDKTHEFSDIGFVNLQDEKCSGVYILEFSNNEYYIGQAKKINTRIKQHNKNYSDIRTIYFKPVEVDLLLSEENKTISTFETNSLRIRNLKQIDFTNIFNEACQQRWINDLNYNKLSGQKFDNTIVRESFKDRFLLFKEKPYYEEVIQLLSAYFKSTIPNFLASEYNYWTITCLPNHLKKAGCISRVNINAVPVLSIFEEEDKPLSFMIYASKLPYLRYLKQNGVDSLVNQITPFKFALRDVFIEKTEGDVIALLLNQAAFKDALDNPLVLSSLRLFNLRMMNNVGKETKYVRKPTHCLDLADTIINLIE